MISDRFNLSNKLVFRTLELIRRRISVDQEDACYFRFVLFENTSVLHNLTQYVSRALDLISHVVNVLLFNSMSKYIIKYENNFTVSSFCLSHMLLQGA